MLKLALLQFWKKFIRYKNCITLRYFLNKLSFEHSLDYSIQHQTWYIDYVDDILFCPKSSHTCHLNSKIFKTSKLIKKSCDKMNFIHARNEEAKRETCPVDPRRGTYGENRAVLTPEFWLNLWIYNSNTCTSCYGPVSEILTFHSAKSLYRSNHE